MLRNYAYSMKCMKGKMFLRDILNWKWEHYSESIILRVLNNNKSVKNGVSLDMTIYWTNTTLMHTKFNEECEIHWYYPFRWIDEWRKWFTSATHRTVRGRYFNRDISLFLLKYLISNICQRFCFNSTMRDDFQLIIWPFVSKKLRTTTPAWTLTTYDSSQSQHNIFMNTCT